MIKPYLILMLFIVNFTFAQTSFTSELDSIYNLSKSKNAKDRSRFLLEKADFYSNTNNRLSYLLIKTALKEALKSNNDTLISQSYNSLGNAFQQETLLDSALIYHKKALNYRNKIADQIAIADSYNNIGIVYDAKGIFKNALKNYFKALKIYETNNNEDKTAMTLVNIGIVYKTQKEYKKAFYYYKKANDLYLKLNSDFGITVTSGNLGGILINFKNYTKSIEFSNKAKIGYKKLNFKRYLGYPISNIAVAYDSLHNFEEANKNYIEAIKLHEAHDNIFEIANICNAYSNCLLKQKKYPESISFAEKALKYAQTSETYFLEVNAHHNLSKAYAKLGLFEKAYYYANLYNKGMDQLFKSEKTKAVFDVEAKYENEKKSKLLLQIQNKIRERNTLILILSILVISIALIGYLIYRQQKIKSKQKEQEFKLISSIALLESQNKLQEQRITISRDLHDNIGAQLTFIISSINNIKHAFKIQNTSLEKKLSNISNFTKSTILELRDTIWAMNSEDLTLEDLKIRIYNFIEKAKLAVNAIHFDFIIDPSIQNISFSSVEGMNIYRVVQEAVHNSIKYADATSIKIDFRKEQNYISIKIKDNGIGFDAKNVILGNGIFNMKKRINEVHGKLQIVSEPQTGTTVLIQIPNK